MLVDHISFTAVILYMTPMQCDIIELDQWNLSLVC